MMEIEYSYRKLNVYKNAKAFVVDVYELLKKFPREEQYALCDQLRRAAVSVPSNIAEGLSRFSTKEKTHFLEIAYGSLMEVQCQLDIAKDLKYISEDDFARIDAIISEEATIIAGMRQRLVRERESVRESERSVIPANADTNTLTNTLTNTNH